MKWIHFGSQEKKSGESLLPEARRNYFEEIEQEIARQRRHIQKAEYIRKLLMESGIRSLPEKNMSSTEEADIVKEQFRRFLGEDFFEKLQSENEKENMLDDQC